MPTFPPSTAHVFFTQEFGDARHGLYAMGDALTELNHAGIVLARGHRDEATRRFEAAKRQIDALGASLDPDDQFE